MLQFRYKTAFLIFTLLLCASTAGATEDPGGPNPPSCGGCDASIGAGTGELLRISNASGSHYVEFLIMPLGGFCYKAVDESGEDPRDFCVETSSCCASILLRWNVADRARLCDGISFCFLVGDSGQRDCLPSGFFPPDSEDGSELVCAPSNFFDPPRETITYVTGYVVDIPCGRTRRTLITVASPLLDIGAHSGSVTRAPVLQCSRCIQ